MNEGKKDEAKALLRDHLKMTSDIRDASNQTTTFQLSLSRMVVSSGAIDCGKKVQIDPGKTEFVKHQGSNLAEGLK